MPISRPFDGRPHRTVLVVDPGGGRWVQVRIRPRDRVLVQCFQLSLDARLAAGRPPERDRLLAVRAGVLVAPPTRRALAAHWESVLVRLDRRPGPASSRIPLRRDRVQDARDDIDRLIDQLRSYPLVAARGVALAGLLLTDGTGPLYNARATTDLRAAVQDAIRHLDPHADHPDPLAQS